MSETLKRPSQGKDHTLTFFRQSGWLVIATVACGAFMILVHPIGTKMPLEDYALFQTLLRVLSILIIPSAGLQTVLAQEAAASLSLGKEMELKGVIRAALAGTFAVWLLAAAGLAIFQNSIKVHFKAERPTVLWMTLLAVLPALWLPILQGALQGIQNFSWLGFSMIFNGVARFFCMALLVLVFHGKATSAMGAAVLGVFGSLCIAAWPMRNLLADTKELIWGKWLRKTLPLTFGTGSVLFIMNADLLFVHAYYPEKLAQLYGAASIIGIALVMFTTPMAAVMFPKLVTSVVTAKKSSALFNALVGTAVLGVLGAVTCSFIPKLPLSILYHGDREFLRAAPLVKLIMWAMLPVTLANVLIGNLLAKEKWNAVPWLTAAAIGYGLSLSYYLNNPAPAPFDAFRTIIQILGSFSLLLLTIAAFFTWRAKPKPTTTLDQTP